MRTFIAIELNPEIKRPLSRMLRNDMPAAGDVRWCSDQQLHLTLKFLGEVDDATLPDVCVAAGQACAGVEPFSLRVTGLGCFPAPRNPRVLWCGVDDPQEGCRRWVKLVDPLLAELNFKPETRAFTPHITLGRSRSTASGNVLRQVLESTELPETPEMEVHEVVVFESILAPGGARYRALARLPLGA